MTGNISRRYQIFELKNGLLQEVSHGYFETEEEAMAEFEYLERYIEYIILQVYSTE